jgi:hypothetical protein
MKMNFFFIYILAIQVVFSLRDISLFEKMFPATFFQDNFSFIGPQSTEKMHIIDKIANKIKKKINDVIVKG